MTPQEAFEIIVQAATYSSAGFQPGVVVSRAPREVREALKHLTSDIALNVRLDWRVKPPE